MAPLRNLTIEDMKDIDPTLSPFDMLVACSVRAKQIHDAERNEEIRQALMLPVSDDEEQEEVKEKSRNSKSRARRQPVDHGPNPPPPLPQEVKDILDRKVSDGRDVLEVKLVIQKGLYTTDLKKGHNRLAIPINQIKDDFLNDEEKEYLMGRHEQNKKNFIDVKIIEPCLNVDTVKLVRWDMVKDNGTVSSMYALNGTWNTIKERNGLGLGMVVQVWAFRVGEELVFALVNLHEPRND